MKLLSLFILVVTCLASCDKERCKDGVICDDYYAIVDVVVKDENGSVVILDSAVVKMGDKSFELEVQNSSGRDPHYIIATDSNKNSISFDGTKFHFYGWLGGELVVDEVFLIGRDCCHIRKYEGPDEVAIS